MNQRLTILFLGVTFLSACGTSSSSISYPIQLRNSLAQCVAIQPLGQMSTGGIIEQELQVKLKKKIGFCGCKSSLAGALSTNVGSTDELAYTEINLNRSDRYRISIGKTSQLDRHKPVELLIGCAPPK